MNKAMLMGRLTRDPELKYLPNGSANCNFTVAVNREFKNSEGVYEADFITCVAWRKDAEFLAKFFKKGNRVRVDGRNQSRSYETTDGRKVYVQEVIVEKINFVDPREQNGTNASSGNGAAPSAPKPTQTKPAATNPNQASKPLVDYSHEDPVDNFSISDDDLPF